jgi:outer membrane protein OmpA-like peptidoglycan-associated protein
MRKRLNKIRHNLSGKTACAGLFAIFLVNAGLFAHCQQYEVKRASFSTRTNDEFSPVFFKGGIVFCSNQRDNSLVAYTNGKDRLFSLFFTSEKNRTGWKYPRLLAKEITTGFNDGPGTFTKNGDKIYYSRNNRIEASLRNITDTSNKLGIYSAELINGTWNNIKPFPYNSALYSICTPALSPDDKRIYFSSDKPGGMGGMDLYYCDWCGNDWCPPVNMGPAINTPGNESFPFAGLNGKVYFASDGHGGYGGKDLFYTMENNGGWMPPVHLDEPINSAADDFGLAMDSTSRGGYFSSHRMFSDDIFIFSQVPVEFSGCDTVKENNYCYTFYDEHHKSIDTLNAIFIWDFGNGILRRGEEVKHCFPGPGEYSVRLDVIDAFTGNAIAKQVEYQVVLDDIEQASIHSNNIGMVNQPMVFDATRTNLKDFSITDYEWDFGSGFVPGEAVMHTTFTGKGEYAIRLGLIGAGKDTGVMKKACVVKTIRIFDACEEYVLPEKDVNKQNGSTEICIFMMDDLSEKQKMKIKEAFKEPGWSVAFDQYGINPSSYPFLDKVAEALRENPELRLEMEVNRNEDEKQGDKMRLSEKWAHELAFFLKNKGSDMNAIGSTGAVMPCPCLSPVVHESRAVDDRIVFMFMKR